MPSGVRVTRTGRPLARIDALKRRAGVKDAGNLLPGHGGLMARRDGLVGVSPAAALLVLLLG